MLIKKMENGQINKSELDVFPWIEVDTHPFMGTTNLVGIDIPRLRIYKHETREGVGGYFVFFQHNTFENQLTIKSGALKKADINVIHDKVTESGFFEMEDVYEEAIFDGGASRIIVQRNSEIKTVSHLRYTARQGEKKVPVEFTDLHNWLIEFATSKCPPGSFGSKVFKLQLLKE